jgi:hypothetical protein
MEMIGHAADRDQFLLLLADDPSDVLLDPLFVIRLNQALSSMDREDNLNVDLRVGVGHVEFRCSRSDLPRFRSAGAEALFLWRSIYKHVAPVGAGRFPLLLHLRSLSRRSIRSSCAQPVVEFSLLAKVGVKVPPDPTHLSGVVCRESVGVGSWAAVDHSRFVEDSRFLWAAWSLAQGCTGDNVTVAGNRHQSGNADHEGASSRVDP